MNAHKILELKNIKSYSKETIDFFEGINGICGENGHGKTTILEAIGYVLFDFLPFNHSDSCAMVKNQVMWL